MTLQYQCVCVFGVCGKTKKNLFKHCRQRLWCYHVNMHYVWITWCMWVWGEYDRDHSQVRVIERHRSTLRSFVCSETEGRDKTKMFRTTIQLSSATEPREAGLHRTDTSGPKWAGCCTSQTRHHLQESVIFSADVWAVPFVFLLLNTRPFKRPNGSFWHHTQRQDMEEILGLRSGL